jgi:cytochrome c oxidase cbb3-type subunit 3
MLAAAPLAAWAQDTANLNRDLILLLMYTAITVAVVCLLLVLTVFVMIQQKAATSASAEGAAAPQRKSFWKRSLKTLTAVVPIEKEDSIDLGHSYDGIRELDNRLPPWWLYGFYATIAIGIAYMWYYHVYTDWTSQGEYQEEVRIAEVKKADFLQNMALQVDETNVEMLTSEVSLANGKKLFTSLCVAGHAADGGGGIGPNFTDNYWIHGGSIKDIFKTVKYGVPEKGMISWQDQLNPVQMHEVSSYIKTLTGTTPAAPKDPQGDLYEEKAPEEAPAEEAPAPQEIVSN